jgi:NADH-quinone oxidoreductase subunit C
VTNEILQQKIEAKFGDEVAGFETPYDMLTFNCSAPNNLKVLTFLKEDAELGFTFLNDLTAIHYPNNLNEELCVVYMLQNMKSGIRIRLKVNVPITKPEIFTATSLFSAANWMEREAFDFFGVQFIGHPNLIRIMNVDEMDYHPLRKEYPVEDQTRVDKDDDMFGRKRELLQN